LRNAIRSIVVIVLSFFAFPTKGRSANSVARAKSAICLPAPVKIVYPAGTKSYMRHPHQYSTEKYDGELTVEIGDSKRFDLTNRQGIRIEGLDPKKSHKIKYRHNGKVLQELKVRFEDPNFDLVIDQRAYEGAFRTLPPKNTCPFEETVSVERSIE
jgi:hypothetical protein